MIDLFIIVKVGLALVASCFVLRLYCRHSGTMISI